MGGIIILYYLYGAYDPKITPWQFRVSWVGKAGSERRVSWAHRSAAASLPLPRGQV